MGSWLRTNAPLLASLALTLAAAQLGCYKPNITEGGLRCNMTAGAKACPEGFKCDPVSQKCYTMFDAAVDRDTGAGTDTDADSGERPICIEPIPNCTPGSGTCDPFCRTGCDCEEKCSVNSQGALTCNLIAAGQRRFLLEPCQIQGAGTAGQTDPCAPGLVCLEDSCGGGGVGRCYQFCRADGDCTNAPCNRDAGGGFKVCDVPYDECVPLAVPNNSGCPGGAIGCYLSTSDPSKTICDCQWPPGLGETDICTLSRQCNPGLVCVDTNGQGFTRCTRVCRLNVPTDCSLGTCAKYIVGGVENSTYGFCR
jgi:hypothetical protein